MALYIYIYVRWLFTISYPTRAHGIVTAVSSHTRPSTIFPISKTKFWWTSIKCIHDNSRVHFVSVSRRCSIVVGSGIIADKVIGNFAEMEGYYVEKT